VIYLITWNCQLLGGTNWAIAEQHFASLASPSAEKSKKTAYNNIVSPDLKGAQLGHSTNVALDELEVSDQHYYGQHDGSVLH